MFVQRLWMDTRRIEHRSSWAWFERGRHDFVGKRAAGGQKEWRRVERSAEDDTEPFGRACVCVCVECLVCSVACAGGAVGTKRGGQRWRAVVRVQPYVARWRNRCDAKDFTRGLYDHTLHSLHSTRHTQAHLFCVSPLYFHTSYTRLSLAPCAFVAHPLPPPLHAAIRSPSPLSHAARELRALPKGLHHRIRKRGVMLRDPFRRERLLDPLRRRAVRLAALLERASEKV